MIWSPKPDNKILPILVLPQSVGNRFNFAKWSGHICTVNWIHAKSYFAVFSKDAPRSDTCTVYSTCSDDASKVGVRMVRGLSGDAVTATLEICTRLDPDLVVVLDSDIYDSNLVVNANPFTGGVDPRVYGIETPDDYPRGEIQQVSTDYHAVPHLSDGGRAWIIGGGPSLNEFDLDAIPKADLIVGCNDACRLPQVEICCFHDKRWGVVHNNWLNDVNVRFWTSGPMRHPNVRRIQQTSKLFSTSSTRISFGTNTGMMAINFAYLAGAREIVLLGFDMQSDNGKTNWHDDNINAPQAHHYATYIQRAKDIATAISRDCPDLRIINLNPNSAMDAFETMYPVEYLPGLLKEDLF